MPPGTKGVFWAPFLQLQISKPLWLLLRGPPLQNPFLSHGPHTPFFQVFSPKSQPRTIKAISPFKSMLMCETVLKSLQIWGSGTAFALLAETSFLNDPPMLLPAFRVPEGSQSELENTWFSNSSPLLCDLCFQMVPKRGPKTLQNRVPFHGFLVLDAVLLTLPGSGGPGQPPGHQNDQNARPRIPKATKMRPTSTKKCSSSFKKRDSVTNFVRGTVAASARNALG